VKKKLALGFAIVLLVLAAAVGAFFFLLFHRTEGQYFDSNGVRIHYTVEGSGEPVVLIHGVAANADLNWRRPGVIRNLARNFQVIAMDCRGHGLSGKPEDPAQYGMEMVEDVPRLLDHLGIEKAHIAGYSMGGFLVLKLMTVHPERIRSAAICAAGWKDPDNPGEIPDPYSTPEPPQAESAAVLPLPQLAKRTDESLPLVHSIRSWVGDQIMDSTVKKAIKKSWTEWLVTKEQLKANTVPAICLIGTDDGLLQLAEDMKQYMANLEFVLLPGANHLNTPLKSEFKKRLHEFFLAHRQGQG
jgi:pimeloyl-ACP methyl ester carboxylesterase